MKHLFSFLLPGLLGCSLTSAAQVLTNDASIITVTPGATLFVEGGVLNKAAGTLQNDGTVQTTGDFSNAGTVGGDGRLLFSGTTDQQLTPGSSPLANVEVANTGAATANRVMLVGDLTVTGQLLLTSGRLRTDPGVTLSLPDGATLSGEAPGRTVQGNLRITRNAVAGVVDFGHGLVLDGTGQSLGAVSVTRTAGLATGGLSFGQNMAGTTKGIDRIWRIVPASQPTAPVPLTLSWLPEDDNGLTSFNPAQLWQSPAASGPWGRLGAPTNASTRSLTGNASTLNFFTISNAANPLPVELMSFTAEPLGDDALLKWSTASEKNNDHFDVEASADGQLFRRIGQVAGKGSTAQRSDYRLTDRNLARYAADVVYYRLRQVDRDGTASFSPVRTVQAARPTGLTAVAWPVPFHTAGTTLTIRTATAGPTALTLHDALGRMLFSRTLPLGAGSSSIPLAELGQLATGVYVLSVQQGAQHSRLRVVRE
jgi:hypothetical protein